MVRILFEVPRNHVINDECAFGEMCARDLFRNCICGCSLSSLGDQLQKTR